MKHTPGPWGEDGPKRATYYHCEECADLFFSLYELGFCINIEHDMHDVVKDYHEIYGSKKNDD